MQDTQSFALPARFDPQILADRNISLSGEVSVATMSRLRNAAVSLESTVRVDLNFSRSMFGCCTVDGGMMYALGLRCERCLEEVPVSLNPTVKLSVKHKSQTFYEKTKGYDYYEYEGKYLDLASLVEDELLLALPLTPKHKDISLCNPDMIAWLAAGRELGSNTKNPFAVLKC